MKSLEVFPQIDGNCIHDRLQACVRLLAMQIGYDTGRIFTAAEKTGMLEWFIVYYT